MPEEEDKLWLIGWVTGANDWTQRSLIVEPASAIALAIADESRTAFH